jgi:hypothetical protein
MGNRAELITALLIAFSLSCGCAQAQIKGFVKDDANSAGLFANVVLKDTLGKIIAYTVTNNDGSYSLKTDQQGFFNLHFSALSYENRMVSIHIEHAGHAHHIDVNLKAAFVELNEVVIRANRPISVKGDTIVFDAQSFATGNEEVVEDLLRKIPGLNIDADGTIKVGNQEVEKVMVEGDDFFDRGYKVLTKNMPSHPIGKVEVLQNYSNNRLLKGIEQSDKVALNLRLKENAKRVWFGNAKVGYGPGPENRHEAKANLMNFGKQTKYYFLTNLNNIGYNATGDINHLIRPVRFGEPASLGDNQQIHDLISLNASPPNFNRSRTNFNDSRLLSLNAIFNPAKKLKIKTLGFLHQDENDFFRDRKDVVDVRGTTFTNNEDFALTNKQWTGFGKVDMNYDVSDKQSLESSTRYNGGNQQAIGSLLFNGLNTLERLQADNQLFDQKITYSHKLNNQKAVLLTGRFINEQTPQNYAINQFFYQELFSGSGNADNVRQTIKNSMQFAGAEAHLLDRRKNGNLLEVRTGHQWRRDQLISSFSLLEAQQTLGAPPGWQNDLSYQTSDWYIQSKYRYEIRNFALIGKLDVHQLFNSLKTGDSAFEQQPFFVNPSIGINWELNDKNKIKASYAHNTTNATLLEVYDQYVLTGFRSFTRGTGDFNQLDASALLFNYQLGNWSDRFFINTQVLHTNSHDFFSTNTFIRPNFALSDKMIIQDRTLLDAHTQVNYYFKRLSSNLRLNLGYSSANFKNIVNDSELREVTSGSYQYELEFRSAFQGFFNFSTGSRWLVNTIETSMRNSFTDNMSFLDFSFVFNNRFDIQMQAERYYFGNLADNNVYYFLDFEARYMVKENKFTLALTGKNLFNTETFRSFSISDIGTSVTEYRLLPRFALLKLEYRF